MDFMALARCVSFPARIHHINNLRIPGRNYFSRTNEPVISSSFVGSMVSYPSSVRMMRRNAVVSGRKYAADSNQEEPNTSEHGQLPTMTDILGVANAQSVNLQLKSFGPFFTVKATSLLTNEDIGRADGFITFGFGEKILHLESIRMSKQAFKMQKSMFGVGLLVGAVAIRHGYDCNCRKAELLAINDSHLYHSKLVRFYTRLGFKAVYEVTGSSLVDVIHMLAWGGTGTRMDGGIEELLTKWSGKFRPQSSDS